MRDNLAPITLKNDDAYNESLPTFPVDTNQPKMMAFVDAVCMPTTNAKENLLLVLSLLIVEVQSSTVPKHNPLLLLVLLKQRFLLLYLVYRFPFIYNLYYMNFFLNAKNQLLSR